MLICKKKKIFFEMNLANWLSALVLLYNRADLYAMMLCAKQIGSIQQHSPLYTNQISPINKNKIKLRKNLESSMDSIKLTLTAARFISNHYSSLRLSTYGAGCN